MRQRQTAFVMALTIVVGLSGLYVLVPGLLAAIGVMPLELQVDLSRIGIRLDTNSATVVGLLLSSIMGILLLVSAYGLWESRNWGRWLVALFIALNILGQSRGHSIISFRSTVGTRTTAIDLGMLLEVVLIVAVLSLPRAQALRSAAVMPPQGPAEQPPSKGL
jgi:uncharacterized membrane protein (DUF2068 family)